MSVFRADTTTARVPENFQKQFGGRRMEFSGDGLDEVLVQLYPALLAKGAGNTGTRGGTIELLATSLRIANPRARLSRSENRGHPFSAIGELLWYLSGSDRLEFVKPYVPPYEQDAINGVIPGAYGPRIFSMRGKIDQLSSVARLLQKRAGSRRAVVQIFNAEDIAGEDVETPCTTTLQFHLRDNRLHMSTTLRSNDA
jgi:thymidylate synthase